MATPTVTPTVTRLANECFNHAVSAPTADRSKHCAALIGGNRIHEIATNFYGGNSFERLHHGNLATCTTHAEINVILRAMRRGIIPSCKYEECGCQVNSSKVVWAEGVSA